MSDPFDAFDDEDSQEQADPPEESPAQKRLDREKAKLRKELDELKAYKAEREKADRGASITATAAELGINPKHAAFYQDEDASPEAIKAWAIANDFLAFAEGEEPAEVPTTGFTPTVIEGTPPGSKIYEFDEWMKLSQTDPAKAAQLWTAGRVAEAVRD